MRFNKNQLGEMPCQMLTLRKFEEKVAKFLVQGVIHGTGHLYIGEEAVAGEPVVPLRDDYITSTYKRHGPYIARG